jgi:hypothetical protein
MDARVWLFQHGFTIGNNEHHFKVRHLGCTVNLRLEDGFGKTSVRRHHTTTTLREFDVSDLRIDEHGMLHGAGIDNYFIDRISGGESAPPWFPAAYETRVRRTMANSSWGRKVRCGASILDWATMQGFERVGHRVLRGEYLGVRTEMEIGIDVLTIRLMDEEGNFTVTDARFGDFGYNADRIMRNRLDKAILTEDGAWRRR